MEARVFYDCSSLLIFIPKRNWKFQSLGAQAESVNAPCPGVLVR